ncbi:hypothetical protein P4O66_009825 [Electrophorus voltai]|uniref:Uncharacterized protein n=1 Tax=Electrophorus voltai TaxID=2609070 RepID=A0AAD8ZB91_9TELE|nr:hypothetical protein P4O66_009825 [Electrophorus voltai]
MPYQQLLPVFRVLEQERARLAEVNQALQERLHQAEDQISSVQASLQLKEQSFLQLRTQQEEITSKLSPRGKEQNSSGVQHFRHILDEKKRDDQRLQEQSQRAHTLRCQELDDQIRLVKSLWSALSSCHKELSSCQKQILDAQNAYKHQLESSGREVRQLERQLEDEKALAFSELQKTKQRALETGEKAQRHQREAAGLSSSVMEVQGELDQMRKEVEHKDQTLKDTEDKFQQRALQLNHVEVAVQDYNLEMEQKLACLQGALERSASEVTERSKQVEYLTERLELVQKNPEQSFISSARPHRVCKRNGLSAAAATAARQARTHQGCKHTHGMPVPQLHVLQFSVV